MATMVTKQALTSGPFGEIPVSLDVFHVFLSSPGDMEYEREAVRQFFDSLNQTIARPFKLRFDVIDWENCTTIGYQNTQELITDQTLKRFRKSLTLVIGLMGQRFGTRTGRFESGTQAEFQWAAAHKKKHGHPEIKWFFRRVEQLLIPADDDRDTREAVSQWRKVKKFRKAYAGYYKEFPDSASFPEILQEDLYRWFASWIEKTRSIEVSHSPEATQPDVPDFLDNRLSRTLRIVTALEDMIQESPQHERPCLRICAAMSSLAITNDESSARQGEDEYFQLIERERDLVEQLFEQKASLKVLLTWSVKEMQTWQKRTRENVLARMERLKSFCEQTLQEKDKIRRATLVHVSVRERNLLILGDKYVFEGRKLSTIAGFEATQVITDKRRVTQEIEMFDILFRNAVQSKVDNVSEHDPLELNRQLLLHLISRIDKDIHEIATSSV
jgi:hypothetical protein